MSVIKNNVKKAFGQYRKDGNLRKFAWKLICDADYSVRYAWQMSDTLDAVKEFIPQPLFECLWYDGENGVYHLLDFNPNGLKPKAIKTIIK